MDRILLLVRLVTGANFTFVSIIIVCAINNWYETVFEMVRQTAGDKLMHFLLVGVLAFLINLSMRATRSRYFEDRLRLWT